jgi:PAS domain S-box-containing protein
MDPDDLFAKELRAARDRIAELQRRSAGPPRRAGGLLPEALAELDVAIEELSVSREELREQTVELTATRRALEAERERYQELFESAPVAYLVTDPAARIGEANRAAAVLFGVEQRFLAGKPLAAYVAGEDRSAFRSVVNRLHLGDEDRVTDWTMRVRRRSGGNVAVLVTVVAVGGHDGGVRALRWLLRGVEPQAPRLERIPAELAVEQDEARRRNLETLVELDPAADLDGSLQVLLDAGLCLLGVDGVGLMLADPKGRLCAGGGSDDATVSFLRAQEHLLKGPSMHAFLLERVVRCGCVADDPRWPQLAEAAAVSAVGAVLAVPVGLYGGPVGACLLVSAGPREWSDADACAAEAFAAVLAALLELAAEAQRGSAVSRALGETLEHHAVIEQAKGALMARRGIDAGAATDQLRDYARRSGRPLVEVARSLLHALGGVRPG